LLIQTILAINPPLDLHHTIATKGMGADSAIVGSFHIFMIEAFHTLLLTF